MKSLKEFLEELEEVSPPGKKYEEWIKKNKERFIDRYGEEEGTRRLYARAWNMKNKFKTYEARNRSKDVPARVKELYKEFSRKYDDKKAMGLAWRTYQKEREASALATA